MIGLRAIAGLVAALAAASFFLGRRRALRSVSGDVQALHSLPGHYGWYAALWSGLPGAAVVVLGMAVLYLGLDTLTLASLPEQWSPPPGTGEGLFLDRVRNAQGEFGGIPSDAVREAAVVRSRLERGTLSLTALLALAAAGGGAALSLRRVRPQLRARSAIERVVRVFLLASSALAVLVTVAIVLSLVLETVRFFRLVSPVEFLFGLHWSPQVALRPDQVGSSGAFGAVPLFAGTLLITGIAMGVAVPVGLMAAIYMSFYADRRVRALAKPTLEILAGVPTVVYGFFAVLIVAPVIRELGDTLGLDVASESALAAGLVMGVMIIPFVSSLSDDAITAVPESLHDASYGLGATRSETIRFAILPAALPGLVAAFLLAVSRAVGETMIVVMAAGLAANLTANPLEAVTTVTVQIVALLTGDQEFEGAKTLSAFALGLTLFLVTLALNLVALRVAARAREGRG